ncbi:MAG TPA: pirin family protein [Myxococcota bacterium]
MIRIRQASERGRTRTDWLDSRHSFAFGDYRDPAHLGFRNLRVINDDRVAPGKGFAPHAHRDMEIVTVVLDGALEHRDSLGNGSVIKPGEVQRMSAGTGITHSEFNPSPSEPVHFLQIWLLPERAGLAAGYEQRAFAPAPGLQLLASPDGRDGSLRIQAQVDLYAGRVRADGVLSFAPRRARQGWLHVVRGEVGLAGMRLGEGDGAALADEAQVDLHARAESELLLFDLA